MLENGSDVRVVLDVSSKSITALDAGVSRYGLHELVFCSATPQPFRLTVEDRSGAGGSTVTLSQGHWLDAGTRSAPAFRLLSAALAEQQDVAAQRDSGMRFAQSAAAFDAVDDQQRATIAWSLASRCSALGMDRELAKRSFGFAYDHLKSAGWTCNLVVLLNNFALFLAPEDTRQAQQRIRESFALQRKLRDPRLSAAIENNVCLLDHQFGDLNLAEACFARILSSHEALHSGPASTGAARNNLALVLLSKGQYRVAAAAFRRAAAERIAGEDRQGYVISIGNLALCLYELGEIGSSLSELHAAYAFANDHGDLLGRAKIAEYLAAIYGVFGDSDTANAFAAEAEALYRRDNLVANLAPTLRLRARIESDRHDLDLD